MIFTRLKKYDPGIKCPMAFGCSQDRPLVFNKKSGQYHCPCCGWESLIDYKRKWKWPFKRKPSKQDQIIELLQALNENVNRLSSCVGDRSIKVHENQHQSR